MLRWYAVILLQWVNGYGLSYIIERALDYKRHTPGSTVKDKDGFSYVEYDDSMEHRNAVMAEVLDVIENVVTFRILNYFLKTEMHARIPITKENFENQKQLIKEVMKF